MLRICNVILWSKSNGPLFAGVETFGRRRSKTGKRLPWSDPETGAFSTRLSLCRTCLGFSMLLVTRQLTDPAVAKTQSDYAERLCRILKVQTNYDALDMEYAAEANVTTSLFFRFGIPFASAGFFADRQTVVESGRLGSESRLSQRMGYSSMFSRWLTRKNLYAPGS